MLATESARPKTIPAARLQPHNRGDADAEQRRDSDLDDGAGQRDAANGQQIFQGKMQTDAEHQQHDADFGELARQFDVGNKAGRGGTDDDAGDQVADQRRQLQASGEKADDQAQAPSGGNGA